LIEPVQKNRRLSTSETFAAFKYRNYRLWFFGQLVSLVGTWMQNTAQGYLIYQLTGSAAFLGYVGFAAGVPSWLFILYGGVIADRIPRRTLMIITQSTMMLLAFVLAGLVYTNAVQPWHILVLSFLLGTANAFDVPARQAFILELVNREAMTNAIAFNATMFNGGAIIGPAIAGLTYAAIGPAGCFLVNGISFLAVIGALLLMHIKPQVILASTTSTISALRESVRYVRADRLILTLCISVFIFNIFGFGLVTLMPAWAVHILGGDVTTNGLLMSARGVGAVIGSFVIAGLSMRLMRGKMWAISSYILPIVMIIFAATRWEPLSMLTLAVMGFSLVTIMNNSNAMVQSRIPDELRGRVMGLYSLMFMGGGPIGSLLIGTLADWLSEPTTVVICSVVLLVFSTFIWLRRPEIRRLA
jgi:MFS family permease